MAISQELRSAIHGRLGSSSGAVELCAILDSVASMQALNVAILAGAGIPVDGIGGTGAGTAGPGSLYVSTTYKLLYQNAGTKADPAWSLAGSESY